MGLYISNHVEDNLRIELGDNSDNYGEDNRMMVRLRDDGTEITMFMSRLNYIALKNAILGFDKEEYGGPR